MMSIDRFARFQARAQTRDFFGRVHSSGFNSPSMKEVKIEK
jgi:hypothetical protein